MVAWLEGDEWESDQEAKPMQIMMENFPDFSFWYWNATGQPLSDTANTKGGLGIIDVFIVCLFRWGAGAQVGENVS